jgi:hypothetical protein
MSRLTEVVTGSPAGVFQVAIEVTGRREAAVLV